MTDTVVLERGMPSTVHTITDARPRDPVYEAKADNRRLQITEARAALTPGELEDLNDNGRQLHERALNTLLDLQNNPDALLLRTAYCQALKTDFGTITQTAQSLLGADQIVTVARNNYIKQIDTFLIGAQGIVDRGSATIRSFGSTRSFTTVDDITHEIRTMQQDIEAMHDVPDFTSALPHLEKYMFDGRNLERDPGILTDALVIRDPNSSVHLVKALGEMGIVEVKVKDATTEPVAFGSGDVAEVVLPQVQSTNKELDEKMRLYNAGDHTTNNLFYSFGDLPKTVVIEAPSAIELRHTSYQSLLVDWLRIPREDRPNVIFFTPGYTPELKYKHELQGFLFCSDYDELKDIVSLSNQLADSRQTQMYKPEILVPGQREAYNNSDLREWENITADTYQSLKHIIQRIEYRNNLLRIRDRDRYTGGLFATSADGSVSFRQGIEPPAAPERDAKTIVDFGTGEGRIAQMLARLGYNVMGVDISEGQLQRSRTRIVEEGEGFRGKAHPGLSYVAVERLEAEGVIAKGQVNKDDDALVAQKYLTQEGSFFDLQPVLNKTIAEWNKRFPGVDPYAFFDRPRDNPHVFTKEHNRFSDAGFDVALFNWNTFCETGSPETQKKVLEQILNVMWPGGELILEIPDRNIEPYASALRKYHEAHPDEPYGTIRDPKPPEFNGLDGEELYPPRYFPDINELVLLLKSVGYEIDIHDDVQSYLVTGKDPKTGEEKLTLKEFFITARKSK